MDDVLRTDNLLRQKTGPIHGFVGSLYFRNYRMLWFGNMLTTCGQWMENVAAAWLMLELTGSPFLVGLIAFCRGIPMLVLSLFAGVLADRLDRRRFMIVNQALIALIALVMASLILVQWIAPWQLLLGSFLGGTVFAMIFPTRQALVPGLVSRRHLPNAVVLYSIANNLTRILGPSLAGALIGLVGIAVCYYLEAVAYVGAFWTSVQMRAPSNVDESSTETVWETLRAGIAYIRNEKRVFALLLLAGLTSLFGMPYLSMLPVLARREYNVDASGLGLMMASMGIGALAGSAFLAWWANPPRRGALTLLSVLAFSLAIVALSLAGNFYVACAVLAVIGLTNSFNMAIANTLVHQLTPDPLRGRVMSAYVMTFGMQPLGSLAVGAIAEVANAPLAIGLGGAVSALAAVLIAILVPELRKLE